MPELPEVETTRRELEAQILGRRFAGMELSFPQAVRYPSPEGFSRLIGQKIEKVKRRGKYLLIVLSEGEVLIIHLKMSGSLLLKPTAAPPDRFTRNTFFLNDGLKLEFADPRKLGVMWLVDNAATVVGRLGPEPLAPSFTPAVLARCLQGRRAPIKAVLCDQGVVAGIGNIYADEALFAAGINPLREAGSLSEEEIECLHQAIGETLRGAIARRGTSLSNYRDPQGEPGTNQAYLQVSRRQGSPCRRCGHPIERIALRGRGTYFCPRCQV